MHDPREGQSFDEIMNQYKFWVNKTYLNDLASLSFCPLATLNLPILLYKVSYLPEPQQLSFFTFVLNALGYTEGVLGYIFEFGKDKFNFYIGLKSLDNLQTASQILIDGLSRTFPSIEINELSLEDSSHILNNLFNSNTSSTLSAAIVIPNNTEPSSTPINQYFSKLNNQQDLLALFLACPVNDITCIKYQLTKLYTTISTFSQTNASFSSSHSNASSNQSTDGSSTTQSLSCTSTEGSTKACNSSRYISISPSTSLPLAKANPLNLGSSLNQSSGVIDTSSHSISTCNTKTSSSSTSHSCTHSDTKSTSESLSFAKQNKEAFEALLKLDALIKRLSSASSPMFCFAAYFVAPTASAAIRSAFTYTGLAKSPVETSNSFVLSWQKSDPCFTYLLESLRHFNHLHFKLKDCDSVSITTTELITSSELVNTFYFPFKETTF